MDDVQRPSALLSAAKGDGLFCEETSLTDDRPLSVSTLAKPAAPPSPAVKRAAIGGSPLARKHPRQAEGEQPFAPPPPQRAVETHADAAATLIALAAKPDTSAAPPSEAQAERVARLRVKWNRLRKLRALLDKAPRAACATSAEPGGGCAAEPAARA